SQVYYAVVSDGGRWVCSQTVTGEVSVWSTATGRRVEWPLWFLPPGERNPLLLTRSYVRFSPDDRLAAQGVEGEVRIWRTETCEPVGEPIRGEGYVALLRWLSSGILYVYRRDPEGDWGEGRGWNVETGKPTGEAVRHQGRRGGVQSFDRLAFSPDGKCVATYSPTDSAVRFWDDISGKQLGEPFRLQDQGVPDVKLQSATAMVALGNQAWSIDLTTGAVRQIPLSTRIATGMKGNSPWLPLQTHSDY